MFETPYDFPPPPFAHDDGIFISVAAETAPDGSAQFVSASTIGHRPDMEDEHILAVSLLRGRVWLSAVFDGHGGREVASFLRASFVNAFSLTESWRSYAEKTNSAPDPESPDDAHLLGEAAAEALCVCDKYVLRNLDTFGGSTAIVVFVTPSHIVTVNVGDSRACLLRANRYTQTLSRDHKPVHSAEAERILRAGGRIDRRLNRVEMVVDSPGLFSPPFVVSLAMSRAVGDRSFKLNPRFSPREQCVPCLPEISVVPRSNAQLVLIASDGVWDAFPDPPPHPASGTNAIRALCTAIDAASSTDTDTDVHAIRTFLRECVLRTAPEADNATAILIRLGPAAGLGPAARIRPYENEDEYATYP